MKSIFNKLSLVFLILFVIGIILSAYYLYIFPEELISRTSVVDLYNLSELRPILLELNIIQGGVLFTGLIAIMLLMLNSKNTSNEQVIYVESFKDKKGKLKSENIESNEMTSADERDLQKFYDLIDDSNQKRQFNKIIWTLCKELEASQGALYLTRREKKSRFIELYASFAYSVPDSEKVRYEFGEGLAGQVAKEGRLINIKSVPEGYITILSGLGHSSPTNLLIVPLKHEETVYGVVEIASYKEFYPADEQMVQDIMNRVAEKLAVKSKESSLKQLKEDDNS